VDAVQLRTIGIWSRFVSFEAEAGGAQTESVLYLNRFTNFRKLMILREILALSAPVNSHDGLPLERLEGD